MRTPLGLTSLEHRNIWNKDYLNTLHPVHVSFPAVNETVIMCAVYHASVNVQAFFDSRRFGRSAASHRQEIPRPRVLECALAELSRR